MAAIGANQPKGEPHIPPVARGPSPKSAPPGTPHVSNVQCGLLPPHAHNDVRPRSIQTAWRNDFQPISKKSRSHEEQIVRLRDRERDYEAHIAWLEGRLDQSEQAQRGAAEECESARAEVCRLQDEEQQREHYIAFIEQRLYEKDRDADAQHPHLGPSLKTPRAEQKIRQHFKRQLADLKKAYNRSTMHHRRKVNNLRRLLAQERDGWKAMHRSLVPGAAAATHLPPEHMELTIVQRQQCGSVRQLEDFISGEVSHEQSPKALSAAQGGKKESNCRGRKHEHHCARAETRRRHRDESSSLCSTFSMHNDEQRALQQEHDNLLVRYSELCEEFAQLTHHVQNAHEVLRTLGDAPLVPTSATDGCPVKDLDRNA